MPVSSTSTDSHSGPQNRAQHGAPGKRCCGRNSFRKGTASRRRAKRTAGSSKARRSVTARPERPTGATRGLGSLGGGSAQLPEEHLEGVPELAVDAQRRGGLVAGMHQAVLAARVLAVTILVPGGVV